MGYTPFADIGSDSYILVSPRGNILYTCDPTGIGQILHGSLFDKPPEIMKILDIFGPTITGANNHDARRHRKATASFFNELTMQRVWKSTAQGAEAALRTIEDMQRDTGRVGDIRPVLARLSLHIVNAVCFNEVEDCECKIRDQVPVRKPHKLSYSQAMHRVLDHMPTIFFMPQTLLSMTSELILRQRCS